MGLRKSYLEFIESSINSVFGDHLKGLRMIELGDQVIREFNIAEETGKAYFENKGFEHISVDFNGLHGAVSRDLTKPEQFRDWHNTCDVLTNAGTTEHVEPFESQYECFNIIHDCLKVGGIAIHLIPDVHERDERDMFVNHCRYYYSEAFFEFLAKQCDYELLANTVVSGLRCAAIKKTSDVPFLADREKFLEQIAQRNYSPGPKAIIKGLLEKVGIGNLIRRLGIDLVPPDSIA